VVGADVEPDSDRPDRSPRGLVGGAIERVVTDNLEKIAVQSRALVVVAGIVPLAAIVLTFRVDDALVRVTGLLVFLTLMLAIVWLLFQTSTTAAGDGVEGGHAEVAEAIDVVRGQWWQVFLDDASPGISVITVALSVLPNRHRLSGMKYSEHGRQTSRWEAGAVGLASIHPVKLFYLWGGRVAGSPELTGVGVFEFTAGTEGEEVSGDGWFTTGNVEHGDFSRRSRVHLQRVTAADAKLLKTSGAAREALIRERYEELTQRFRQQDDRAV
jgi:hypothetical protein